MMVVVGLSVLGSFSPVTQFLDVYLLDEDASERRIPVRGCHQAERRIEAEAEFFNVSRLSGAVRRESVRLVDTSPRSRAWLSSPGASPYS
jgi:hypothetical protein